MEHFGAKERCQWLRFLRGRGIRGGGRIREELEGFVGAKTITYRGNRSAYMLPSAISPSLGIRTDIQHQALRRGRSSVDSVGAHATHDGAAEVDVEDGEEVDDVEHDGDTEEAHTSQARHAGRVVRASNVMVNSERTCNALDKSSKVQWSELNFHVNRNVNTRLATVFTHCTQPP